MLSQTADHALRALLAIARHGGERPLRVEELAHATGAPRNYLGKTLGALVKAGMLRSVRGPAGGFSLVMDPATITVAHIADLFAEAPAPRRCLLGEGPCDPHRPCIAHARWSAMATSARAPLDTTTLADLLAGPSRASLPASPLRPSEPRPHAGVVAGHA